jgi:hypothetical protein
LPELLGIACPPTVPLIAIVSLFAKREPLIVALIKVSVFVTGVVVVAAGPDVAGITLVLLFWTPVPFPPPSLPWN